MTVLDPPSSYKTLVRLDEVMETLQLGPNGGLVYCMEVLADNYDWLEKEISALDDT